MLVLSLKALGVEHTTSSHIDQDNDGCCIGREPSDCCNALLNHPGFSGGSYP